ncbi:ABC transporter related protein [Metallosphaera sedula]|uniref:ABC transporter related protein n=2 Tax=Metallosphaera sedula TaxID=43687 RepID=A4YEX8_METS5|nr:ABC transporter related protein [Metallosphaera sedula DSM 5348]AIM26966.1 ABC transporter related protein [Metallosphaera sedula]
MRVGRSQLSSMDIELSKGVNLVLGQNGAGKTTLLRSIIESLRGSSVHKGYMPAEFSSPEIPVKDVLLAGTRNPLENYLEFSKELEITHLLDRTFSTLSTGEKKLVLVVKALSEGQLVLMDEPTSGLDVRNQAKVISLVSRLRSEKDFLIATHDLNWIERADQVIVMKKGKIIWQSSPDLLNEQVLETAYECRVKKVNIDNKKMFILDF